MEKINQAREKITKESLDIGTPLSTYIEELVNEHCKNNAIAETVLNKSLEELIKNIEKEARGNCRGNVGCISDSDVTEMAKEYYEIFENKVIDILDLI